MTVVSNLIPHHPNKESFFFDGGSPDFEPKTKTKNFLLLLHFLEQTMTFEIFEYDHANHLCGSVDEMKFNTAEAASDHLLKNVFHAEQKEIPDEKTFRGYWVFEHNGKLYQNSVYYGQTTEYDLLFKNYTEDKPTTMDGLRRCMSSQQEITLDWGDRAPVSYWIRNNTEPTHKQPEWMKKDDQYEEENDQQNLE